MVWPVGGRAEKDGGRAGMEVGGRIRELRTERGMSQDDLAARVYVSRQTISSWENGVRQNGLTGKYPATIP